MSRVFDPAHLPYVYAETIFLAPETCPVGRILRLRTPRMACLPSHPAQVGFRACIDAIHNCVAWSHLGNARMERAPQIAHLPT